MSSFLVGPALFAAVAAAGDDDPDLPEGTLLRLLPSTALGLPLAPFLVGPVPPQAMTLNIYWVDRRRAPGTPDLDAAGGELNGWILTVSPEQRRLVGVQILPTRAGAPLLAELLDPTRGRVLVRRSAPVYTLAAPIVSRLHLLGEGPIEIVRGYFVTPGIVFEHLFGLEPRDENVLALPVDDRPWYSGGRGRDDALRRVRNGAPKRFQPPDRPDGSFDPLPPAAEVTRVDTAATGIDPVLNAALGDRANPPWLAETVHRWEADVLTRRPQQFGRFRSADALLLQALDPGIARYLGLMTQLRDRPPGPDPMVWVAAGVFAVDRKQRLFPEGVSTLRIGDILPAPDDFEKRLLARFADHFPGLAETVPEVRRQGREPRVLVTAAAAAPLPDLPDAPGAALSEAAWVREPDAPSARFRQTFRFAQAPLAALLSKARLAPGGWQSRHELIAMPAGADPASRARPVLLSRDGERVGIGTDEDIPAAGAPWRYRFQFADLFGRYGAPGEIDVPAPGRPAPPPPAPQTVLHPEPRAAHDGPAPFGTLEVNIAVPKLTDLAAGALRIQTVKVSLAAESRELDAPEGQPVSTTFNLRELMPMETARLTLEARFVDEAGTLSDVARLSIDIADPRPPKIIPTGPGILWTTRPGPAAEVELRLAWPAPPGTRYRAYLADAQGLDIPVEEAGPPARPRTRAEIAVDGANRARAGDFDMRDRFRLLTEPPLTAGPDGRTVLDERLPRTLSTVQFLRVVPVSERNVEATFAQCGLVPVAVPSDRRPPSPRVSAAIDPATGKARITVEAVGIDLIQLRAAEPGLFTAPPDPAARAPEFRLRRASGPAPEPLYAREIGRGALQFEAGDDRPRFAAVFEDAPGSGLAFFVSFAYWAEVRMPPERRVPLGAVEVPPAGGIVPTEARQAADAPGAFSLPSVPALAMRVPPEAPVLAPEQVTARTRPDAVDPAKFVIEVNVAGGPTVPPNATGPYKVRLWIQPDGKNIKAVAEPELKGGQVAWASDPQDPAAGAPPVTVFAALVDPNNRRGPVLSIPAARA